MITRADVYKAHEEEHLKIAERIKELQYAIAKTQTIVGEMVESAEAVQGEWIDTGNWMGIECSRCKCHSRYVTPFCPQCGAKMKGGDDK